MYFRPSPFTEMEKILSRFSILNFTRSIWVVSLEIGRFPQNLPVILWSPTPLSSPLSSRRSVGFADRNRGNMQRIGRPSQPFFASP